MSAATPKKQRGARRLMAERPGLHAVVGAVKEMEGEKRERSFRNATGTRVVTWCCICGGGCAG